MLESNLGQTGKVNGMPLKLLPASRPDLARMAQIEDASFASSPIWPILFPDGKSAASRDAQVERLVQKWEDNGAMRIVKVVDPELNDTIVAFARWFIFVGEDVRFIKTEPDQGKHIPGSNRDAMATVFEGLFNWRWKTMGKKSHCYLSYLCTDPAHQRRGAGTMLLEWGCDIARRHGVPVFLQSTMVALPVYQKFGFRELGRFEMEVEKFGHAGRHTNVQMIKAAEDHHGPAPDIDDRSED